VHADESLKEILDFGIIEYMKTLRKKLFKTSTL